MKPYFTAFVIFGISVRVSGNTLHILFMFMVSFRVISSYYEMLNMCTAVHVKLQNVSSLLSSSYFEIVE